jgi:hypothetical protein
MENKKNRLDFLLKMKNFRLVGVFPSLRPCLVQNAVHVLLLDLLEVILFLQSGSSSRKFGQPGFCLCFSEFFQNIVWFIFLGALEAKSFARGHQPGTISPVNPSPAPGDCRRFLQ